MRQAIYDLARYKLQEQFTYADAKDIRRTQQALESAIRGVEAFSKQNPSIGIAAPSPLAEIGDPDMAAPGQLIPQVRKRPRFGLGPEPRQLLMMSSRLPWPRLKRALVMFAVFGATLVAFQQRGRLATWVYDLQRYEKQIARGEQPQQPTISEPAPAPPAKKPSPLRPTDYGVYAVNNDALIELQPLPGVPPDIRIAISADLKVPQPGGSAERTSEVSRVPQGRGFKNLGPPRCSDRRQDLSRVLAECRRQETWRRHLGDAKCLVPVSGISRQGRSRNVRTPQCRPCAGIDPRPLRACAEDGIV
jgi:hypothetical protein